MSPDFRTGVSAFLANGALQHDYSRNPGGSSENLMNGGSTIWQDMINREHCFVFLDKPSFGAPHTCKAEAEAESGEEQKHHCLTDAIENDAATNSHNKQGVSSLIRPPANC